jgi:hypothetical protein
MKKSLLREAIIETARYMIYEQQFLLETADAINKQEALDRIIATKGQIFGITFIKKNGEKRVMPKAVTSDSPIYKRALRGGKLPYDPFKKGVFPVYDLIKRDFRMVNLNAIETLKVGSDVFIIQ